MADPAGDTPGASGDQEHPGCQAAMFWAASPSPSQALAPQRSHTHRTGVGAHPRRTRGKPAFIPQAAGVGKGKYSGILDRTATNSRRPACLGSGVAASRELACVSRQRVRSQGPWASAPFGTVTSGAEGRAVGSDAQGTVAEVQRLWQVNTQPASGLTTLWHLSQYQQTALWKRLSGLYQMLSK